MSTCCALLVCSQSPSVKQPVEHVQRARGQKGRAVCHHAQGLLLRDVVVSEPVLRGGNGGGRIGAATFLGICWHVTSPCVRRFDIKIYPRR